MYLQQVCYFRNEFMHKPFNIKRAVTILVIVFIFSLIIILGGYWALKRLYKITDNTITASGYFNFWLVFYPVLFIAEIFIYRWLGSKRIVKKYADIHLWTLVISKVIIPLFSVLFTATVALNGDIQTLKLLAPFSKTIIITGHVLFIIGHAFFALLIVNRNKIAAAVQPSSTEDVLDEFAE